MTSGWETQREGPWIPRLRCIPCSAPICLSSQAGLQASQSYEDSPRECLWNVQVDNCLVLRVTQIHALHFSGPWRVRMQPAGGPVVNLTMPLGPAWVPPFTHSCLWSPSKQLLFSHLITSPGGDHTVPPGSGSRMLSWKACSDSVLLYFGKTTLGVSVRATEFSWNGWNSRQVISQGSGMSPQGEAGEGISHSLTYKVISLGWSINQGVGNVGFI